MLLELPDHDTQAQLLKHAETTVHEMVRVARQTQREATELFEAITEAYENAKELLAQGNIKAIDMIAIKALLLRLDALKARFTDKTFRSYFWDILQSHILSCELEVARIAVRPVSREEEVDAKMVEFCFIHRGWLFYLAGGLDAFCIVAERATRAWLSTPIAQEEESAPKIAQNA